MSRALLGRPLCVWTGAACLAHVFQSCFVRRAWFATNGGVQGVILLRQARAVIVRQGQGIPQQAVGELLMVQKVQQHRDAAAQAYTYVGRYSGVSQGHVCEAGWRQAGYPAPRKAIASAHQHSLFRGMPGFAELFPARCRRISRPSSNSENVPNRRC